MRPKPVLALRAQLGLPRGELSMHVIPTEWLTEKVSVADAEAANMSDGRPFGFQHLKWEKLKAKMVPGDELWEFHSPPSTWVHLMGREGYAVVRQGQIIESLITSAS
jgi:hypothetical protein